MNKIMTPFPEKEIKIEPLTKQDMAPRITVAYTTTSYLDLETRNANTEPSFTLVKKNFDTRKRKQYTVKLFEDATAMIYGIKHNNKVIAFIELYKHGDSRRLYIANLFIAGCERGKHLGTHLIEFAEQKAKALKCRSLFLDTESCNENAIRFYRKCGFIISGFDTSAFSNHDIERKEFSIYFSKEISDT